MEGAGQPQPGHGVQVEDVRSETDLPGKVAPHSWHMTSRGGQKNEY